MYICMYVCPEKLRGGGGEHKVISQHVILISCYYYFFNYFWGGGGGRGQRPCVCVCQDVKPVNGLLT